MGNENIAYSITDQDYPMAKKEDERPAFVKKIGKTTYRVNIHFSITNTETMNDKIMRMLRNEVQQM